MVHQDNAAGRLHRILLDLRNKGSGPSVEDAWQAALGVNDKTDFQVAFAGVGLLVAEIHSQILALRDEIDTDRYLSYIPRWTRFIGMQDRPRSQAFAADEVVTQDELDALGFLADVLHHRNPEGTAAPATVEALRESVVGLINEVTNAEDVDPDFRVFLLQHLQLIDEALRYFRIYGPARLDEVYGHVTMDAGRRRGSPRRVQGATAEHSIRLMISGSRNGKRLMPGTSCALR